MRFNRRIVIPAVAVFAAVSLRAAASAPKPTLDQVSHQVYCLCGCVTLLNRCPHLPSECESRSGMQTVILADIKEGKTDPAILQDLVQRYGEHVLAAPPAAGFNLTVWILPGAMLLIGFGIVVYIVRRWRARVSEAAPPQPPALLDPKILAAVEEEMNKIGTMKD